MPAGVSAYISQPERSPHERVVSALINRLKSKLPCNSGLPLSVVEADDAFKKAVESLVHLARTRLDHITMALSEYLDKLHQDTKEHPKDLSYYHSQLLVAKILSAAMDYRWECAKEDGFEARHPPSSPMPFQAPLRHKPSGDSAHGSWCEPPPLDENVAKYTLSVMLLYVKQTSAWSDRPKASGHIHSDTLYDSFEGVEKCGPSTSTTLRAAYTSHTPLFRKAVHHGAGPSNGPHHPPPLVASTTTASTHKLLGINTPLLGSSAASVNALLSKYVHKILFHVSASNWSVIFSRIRLRIHHFAKGVEDSGPDTNIDMKLLQYCALDRARLVQVFQELSSLLVSMKRDAQATVALALRAAIWNWITIFSDQFIDVMVVQRRLEGAPERVFDTLFQVMNEAGANQRRMLWPTLAALLATSPQRLREAELGISGPQSKGKKSNGYLATISQMMASQTLKVSDVAMVCYLDLCKAAVYVPPTITDSALRALAPEMADELKHRIMDTPHEFWTSQDPIDVNLYADLIVAIWRFDNPGAVGDVFPICLALERSDAVKATAVRALLTIISESKRFEHQPPIEPLYKQVGPQLRAVYQHLLTRLAVDPRNIQSRQIMPAAKKYGNDYFKDPELLLLTLLTLFRLDTTFYSLATEGTTDTECIREACILLSPHVEPAIHVSVARTFHSIASNILDMIDVDRNLKGAAERLGIQVAACLTACSLAIMRSRDNYELLRLHVSMVVMVFDHIFTNPDSPVWRWSDEYRLQGQQLALVSLITTLPCGQMDISQMAVKGLITMASSGNIKRKQPDELYISKDEQQDIYSTFEQLADPGVPVVGRAARQKRVRRQIRGSAYPTAVHITAWAECYRHWQALNEGINMPNKDGGNGERENNILSSSSDDYRAEWQNTLLFLASLGGSCLLDGAPAPHQLSRWCPPELLPTELKTPIPSEDLVANFISTVVDMLTNEDILTRETAKEALGSELHPKLYPLLLAQLDTVISRLFDGSAPVEVEWTEHDITIFVDQTISVLKLLFDRLESASEATHVAVDISHLLLQLVRFLHDSPISFSSTRIKIKFCALCDSLFARADVFILKKSTQVRNTLLESMVQWIGVPPTQDLPALEQDVFQRLQGELDAACLKAATVLLDRLRLQPLDGSIGTDSGMAISRLFAKYLNFFVNAMERTSLFDQPKDQTNDPISIEARAPTPPTKEQGLVRELAITGISRMLSSNMDAGLRHCIIQGYSDDLRMRCTFTLIFSKVIRQGARFDGIETSASLPRRSRLCEMVRGDTLLALAVAETTPVNEVDIMLPVVVNIFDTKSNLLALLKAVIEKEVTRSDNSAELFRANTMCTRFIATVAKVHGYNYLRQILDPLVQQMLQLPPDITFQLDPKKATPTEIETNVETVRYLAQAFLDVITNSVQFLPMICREICAHISDRVSQQWPESKYAAVGGFLFLRFICPAIVSPETVDISTPPNNANVRRGLLLITKIIQNLANNVLFGKEQFMVILNEFLEQNILAVTHFLTNVVQPPEDDEEAEEFLGSSYDEADSIVLHRFFNQSADKVGKELLGFSRQPQDAESGTQSGKRTWDNLCSTLVEMGQPITIPPPLPLASSEHPAYLEFMRRSDHRNIDSIRDLFYLTPTPKNANPVYVLALARVNVETIELDLLITHIFRIMAMEERDFDGLIDCTGFTATSEIPLLWFKIFLELVPMDLVERFSRCFILNPNNAATKFLRKLYHICGGKPLAKRTYAVSSVEDLRANYLNEMTTDALPAAALEKERCEVHDRVLQKSRHGMKLPISLRICTTHLQILSRRTQILWPELQCLLNEIILLSDIGDVYNVSTGQDINEFIIRKSRYGGTLYFSSADRDLIVHGIRIAKGRMRDDNAPAIERTYTSKEISATLLNIGLLNLSSEDDALRTTAYDLVCAVASSLSYEDNQVVPGNGGFIPANPAAFALQTSEKLASHAPQLTLDMVTEFALGYCKSKPSQKMSCLYYLQPWIKNLAMFPNQSSTYFDHTGAKLRDAIRILIDLLIKDYDLAPMIQKTIWAEIAKLDTAIVVIALDELVRAATDGGIGSRRCEIVADTLIVLSSISVRGKILSKLRKAIGKTTIRPTRTMTENAAWNEVAAITRLALYAGYNTKIPVHNQLFVPETVHLITLLAATGPTLMRSTVHGIVVNLIQSLYVSRADDPIAAPRLRQLLEEAQSPTVLLMFGLVPNGPIGDYNIAEGSQDTVAVDTLEALAKFLLRVISAGAQTNAGSNLINVWRARWMSLVISTAFQSSYIQSRAFVVIGVLGTSDVDDDLLYQILVAFRTALANSLDTDGSSLVSMLRCITKVVPGAPRHGRYLPQVVWLAIALLQCGEVTLFAEAAKLLQASLETLDHQGVFDDQPIINTLFNARSPMEDVTQQVDQLLNLSFETNFSFALASIIFRGMRHPPTMGASSSLLYTLLRLTTRPQQSPVTDSRHALRPVPPDALGYFLSLLATTPTRTAYWKLLRESGAGPGWLPDCGTDEDERVPGVPKVALDLLGIQDHHTAVLITSFLSNMLNSAGAEPEREILFNVIADISGVYPDVVAMVYESIQDRVVEAFANVSNPAILHAVGIIFRTSMLDPVWSSHVAMNGSASTLPGYADGVEHGPGRVQVLALEEMQMRGILMPHLLVPRSVGTKMLQWMVDLVSRIIE